MIKGIQKNMILLQTPKNRYFESAYFIMRADLSEKEQKENEMIKEANRIISESVISESAAFGAKYTSPHRRRLSPFSAFLLGSASGVLLVLLVLFLLKLIS